MSLASFFRALVGGSQRPQPSGSRLGGVAGEIARTARERFDVLVTDDPIDETDVVARIHLYPAPDEPHVIVCWRRHISQVVSVSRGAAVAYVMNTGHRGSQALRLYSTGAVRTPDGIEVGYGSIPGPRSSPMSDAIEAALSTAPRVDRAGIGSGRLITADRFAR